MNAVFDKFPTVCVYWMKIEPMFHFHPIRSKEPPILNFPMLDLAKYFYKMAATAGSSCSEVDMKFSQQEFFKVFELVTN